MKSKSIILIIALLVLLSCKTETKTPDSLFGYLPPNASLVIKINNLTNFKSELKNNAFLEKTEDFSIHKNLAKELDGLKHITPDGECILALYTSGKSYNEYVLIAKNNPNLFKLDDIADKTVETLTYQNQKVEKYGLEGLEIFSVMEGGQVIICSSLMLMENIIRTKKGFPVDKALEKLYQASGTNKSAVLFSNLKEPSSIFNTFLSNGKASIDSFSDWISMDFSANSDNINLNGVAIASDSTKNFINLFKGTLPLTNKTPLFAPLNTQAIASYTFDDYQIFAKNQNTYLDRVKPIDSLFNTIEELGIVYLNNQKVVLLSSFGSDSLAEFLNETKASSTTYQNSEIFGLKDGTFLNEGFTALLPTFEAKFCVILENTFVFAESREPLQTMVANYRSSSSFAKNPVYETAMGSLANESSILFLSTNSGIDFFSERYLEAGLQSSIKKAKFSDYSFATQMVSDNSFAHLNFLISKKEALKKTNSVTPLFTLELDTDLATDPQFVKNHRTNRQEIVAQDQNNFLYLISGEGKVLWKKQLEGRIQGKIHQVDIYKNGRLQLAFCTNNQFLIIDRNGDLVPPFNKKFEGGNLNPLAVFDYEGKKDYRFLVTQGEKVFMYNNKNEIVDGFTFTRATSGIVNAPKHFRIGNKDYLVFQLEDKSLKILHRSGGERIKFSQKIDFSDNEVFLYKNKFSTTNKKGVLHQIDSKGTLTSTNFNLNKDHGMYATSKTLVFMNDNILSIRGKKVELDLGVYSPPKIFYIYDKIYVSVTDIQNQKIYLFDSQAKPIANFPVFGNSLIDLIDMDNDKKLELVAKDQENSIVVYKMN